jgi:hypothetical protein
VIPCVINSPLRTVSRSAGYVRALPDARIERSRADIIAAVTASHDDLARRLGTFL